jgi:hypothetical protein
MDWIMINSKQLENVEYFNYFGSMIKTDARYTRGIKSRIALTKAAFNKKKNLFTSKLDLNLRKKLLDQKYLESFEMWCWRRM